MTIQTRVIQNADAASLAGVKFVNTDVLMMYLSTFTPGVNSTSADFITNRVAALDVAAFVLAGTWDSGLDIAGNALLIYQGIALQKLALTATPPILAGGWFIADTGIANVKLYKAFATPISLNVLGDKLLIKPSMFWGEVSDSDDEFIAGP